MKQLFRRSALDLHYISELLHFVFAREQGETGIEFSEDTAKTPHIDPCRVGDPKNYLRSSVEPGLDVGINSFVLEAT